LSRAPKLGPIAVDSVPGVQALPLPTPFSIGPVNSFLIEDEPLTLIDCGPNSATALVALERQLGSIGRRIEELDLILITHQHSDHSGLVEVVAERSGAEIGAFAQLAPYLAHWDAAVAQDAEYAYETMLAHGVDPRVARAVRSVARSSRGWGATTAVHRPLADGTVNELSGRRLEALHVPGHSPSDVAFLDRDAGVAFSGDVMLAGHVSTTALAASLDPAWDGARPRPLLDYRSSLRRLHELDLTMLLPGHGAAIEDPRELLLARIAAQDERIERTARMLEGGAHGAYELAIFERGEIAFAEVLNALSETLGQLDVLASAGRVEERGEMGRRVFRLL
jgi:glyoxylase-like metal-dependent hydrolase (beta-lactamase superfamily II)